MRIIDGGYLCWQFGTGVYGWNNWAPRLYNRALIAMDDGGSVRREIFPGYKRRRAEKRMVSPERHQMWQRVQSFKDVIHEDPRLNVIVWPGLEADDLVALSLWADPGRPLIGQDKDLLQLEPWMGEAGMQTLEGERITVERINRKLPKTLGRHLQLEPGLPIALYLAIMGDKSDGIPRLIPPRKLDEALSILLSENPWRAAYNRYGIQFLRNLMMALLPYPGCFGFEPNENLLETVATGNWKPEVIWSWLDDDLRRYIERALLDGEEETFAAD